MRGSHAKHSGLVPSTHKVTTVKIAAATNPCKAAIRRMVDSWIRHAKPLWERSPQIMKPIFLILTCALLPGCNLMRGVGQDMAAVGQTLTKVSGTEGSNQQQDPAAQPYGQPYEDQAYVEPSEVPK